MKHLSPDRICALADGLLPTAAETGHLNACAECRSELKELKALVQGLEELKTPSKELRDATLQRLGLAPRPRPGLHAWTWGPALAAGLALVLILNLPHFRPRTPSTAPLGSNSAAAQPEAKPEAEAAAPGPQTSAPQQPSTESAFLAKQAPVKNSPEVLASANKFSAPATGAVQPASGPQGAQGASAAHASSLTGTRSLFASLGIPGLHFGGSSSAHSAALAPAAPSASAAQGPVAAVVKGPTGPSAKATPAPPVGTTLKIVSIRNNLIKPGLQQNLSFTVALPESGPLKVQVLDRRGLSVALLYDATAGPGFLDLSWDGGNAASGVYTVLVQTRTAFAHLKVLVVR